MDIEVLTKSFTEAAEKIWDSECPKAEYFSTLASIESIMCFNRNLMPCQSLKMKEYKWQKDACWAQLLSLKNPHPSATEEFVATFWSWKLVRQTIGEEEETNEDAGV